MAWAWAVVEWEVVWAAAWVAREGHLAARRLVLAEEVRGLVLPLARVAWVQMFHEDHEAHKVVPEVLVVLALAHNALASVDNTVITLTPVDDLLGCFVQNSCGDSPLLFGGLCCFHVIEGVLCVLI